MNFSPASTYCLKTPSIKLTYKTLHKWRLFILPPLSLHARRQSGYAHHVYHPLVKAKWRLREHPPLA